MKNRECDADLDTITEEYIRDDSDEIQPDCTTCLYSCDGACTYPDECPPW